MDCTDCDLACVTLDSGWMDVTLTKLEGLIVDGYWIARPKILDAHYGLRMQAMD